MAVTSVPARRDVSDRHQLDALSLSLSLSLSLYSLSLSMHTIHTRTMHACMYISG